MHGRTARGSGPRPSLLPWDFCFGQRPGQRWQPGADGADWAEPAYVETALRVPPGSSPNRAFVPPRSTLGLKACEVPLSERAFCRRLAVRSASAWLAHPPGGASIYPASFTLPLRFGSPPGQSSRDTELRASDLTLQRLPLHRQAGGLRSAPNRSRVVAFAIPSPGGGSASKGHGVTPCGSAPENPSCSPRGKTSGCPNGQEVALSNGAENDTVRVRNHGGKQVLQGRVVGPGEVKIGF